MSKLWQRVRGAIGNALVWSAGWLLAGVAIISVLYPLGFTAGRTFLEAVGAAASSSAVLGFLAGGAFSIYLGSIGRRRRLHELRAGPTAVVAGLLAAVSVPLFRLGLQALFGLSFIVPIEALLITSVLTGVLGGVTAFGTIKVAQASLGPGGLTRVGPRSSRFLPDSTSSPERQNGEPASVNQRGGASEV